MKRLLVIATLVLSVLGVAIPASAANLLYSMPTMTALATGLTGSISGTAGAAVISGPTLTLSQAGTYSLSSMVTTSTAASTFSTAQTAKCWLYRTNNTPGVVANTTAAVVFPIMTTLHSRAYGRDPAHMVLDLEQRRRYQGLLFHLCKSQRRRSGRHRCLDDGPTVQVTIPGMGRAAHPRVQQGGFRWPNATRPDARQGWPTKK